MRLSLQGLQRFLIYCFVFFGPLGSLLTPSFLPYAFRFYHFFLLLFPIFFLRMKSSEWKAVLIFIPFLFYCLISAYFSENKIVNIDSYPIFRSGLLITQYLFVFGAAFCLQERGRLLTLYLIGFFISLVVGYILTIGYYVGVVPIEVIKHLCVEAQMGWGILRFSPGSYPNEYGNVSSFVLSVLILITANRKKHRHLLYFFICLTLIALMLTTTRAAYYSFTITFFYLCFVSQEVRRFSLKFLFLGCMMVVLMKYYSFDLLHIFIEGIRKISLTTGSSGIRIADWVQGFAQLGNSVFWGTGFGVNITTHNVYLELLYELGIVGILVLLVSLIYFFSENHFRMAKVNRITIIGLIHVFLFAATNHNMHHHLTWMTFLFFISSLFSQARESAPEAQKGGAFQTGYRRRFVPRFLR